MEERVVSLYISASVSDTAFVKDITTANAKINNLSGREISSPSTCGERCEAFQMLPKEYKTI